MEAQPGDRLNVEIVRAYVRDLSEGLAAESVVIMVRGLYAMMRAIESDRDWTWLRTVIANLRSWAASIAPVHRKTVPIEDLIELGFDLMERCGEANVKSGAGSALFRDGLMIALLAQRPIRRGNLCQIVLGQHLDVVGDRFWLFFTAEETKTRRPLEYSWPENLEPHLLEYIEVHRPKLLALRAGTAPDPNEALWISQVGTVLSPVSVWQHLVDLTRKRFGFPINPHHFRACVATSIAVNDPTHVYVAAAMLGHSSLSVTHKHYILASALEAGRRHAAAMNKLRGTKTKIDRHFH